jgi:hypothetical protein
MKQGEPRDQQGISPLLDYGNSSSLTWAQFWS